MRILLTIPHFHEPAGGPSGDGREHGSTGPDALPRLQALTACLQALHQLRNRTQCYLDHARKAAFSITPGEPRQVDVVVCTTRGRHLLSQLNLPASYYQEHATDAEPLLLGFECHAVLRDRLGQYDFYGYLEDDLLINDPSFFTKLAWFTRQAGDQCLLQPNRYEVGPHPLVSKAYLDGALGEHVLAIDPNDRQPVTAEALGVRLVFERAHNPHSGCFFLNAAQMRLWARQPHFLDRDTRFIGPLESAASLGIVRTFKVYKPALANADFLEVQHFGDAYLKIICPGDAAKPQGG